MRNKHAQINVAVSQFSHSVVSNSETPRTAACQASLSITNSWSLRKLMSIELVRPSSHLIIFSFRLQSFPTSGSFQMSQLFVSGSHSIGVSASASVLPMNTQGWSPLGCTSWISLQSKGLSTVVSNTTVQKHRFFTEKTAVFPGLCLRHGFWEKPIYALTKQSTVK